MRSLSSQPSRPTPSPRPEGVYEAEWGNAVVVMPSLSLHYAFDLDMGAPIPIDLVGRTITRPLTEFDRAVAEQHLSGFRSTRED